MHCGNFNKLAHVARLARRRSALRPRRIQRAPPIPPTPFELGKRLVEGGGAVGGGVLSRTPRWGFLWFLGSVLPWWARQVEQGAVFRLSIEKRVWIGWIPSHSGMFPAVMGGVGMIPEVLVDGRGRYSIFYTASS